MTQQSWNVLELLRWTTDFFASKGIESPRLDAECLLAHVLEMERLRLYLEYERPVTESERASFRELVRRRAEERLPVALLTGVREFWSMPLRVTSDVLVPRPDTETLIEAVLGRIDETEAERSVLDVGTGSGAVALALARELPKARVTATDVSAAALAVATHNAEALGFADRTRLLEGDLFEPVPGERFDVIASNPPYLADDEAAGLAPELAHEPRAALFAGADGAELLRRLIAGAPDHLNPGGLLALEMAPHQEDRTTAWLTQAGFEDLRVQRDLAGRPRVASATFWGGRDGDACQ